MPPNIVLLINLASTLIMCGIIWFVQVVHYPLFGQVGEPAFRAYEAAHTTRTTCVVGPPMLAELATAGLLTAHTPAGVPSWQTWLGLALVGVNWLSTMALQVPRHNRLGEGYNSDVHRALVTTNWLRTFAWSARSLLVLAMTAEVMRRYGESH